MGRLWHHRSVIVLLRIVLRFLADLAGLVTLSVRPRRVNTDSSDSKSIFPPVPNAQNHNRILQQ
jgi:hypothetical protein